MRLPLLLLAALLVSGCAASFSKEEIAAAFAQRDAALSVIVAKLQQCKCGGDTEAQDPE